MVSLPCVSRDPLDVWLRIIMYHDVTLLNKDLEYYCYVQMLYAMANNLNIDAPKYVPGGIVFGII